MKSGVKNTSKQLISLLVWGTCGPGVWGTFGVCGVIAECVECLWSVWSACVVCGVLVE